MHDTPPTCQPLLTSLADMLYVPMLFYVLTQWEKIKTVPARLLWFGLFVLIKNELMSVRDSYRVYSVGLYLLDFGSLLTCLFGVDALTRDIKPFRYDPEFWYFLAVLWDSRHLGYYDVLQGGSSFLSQTTQSLDTLHGERVMHDINLRHGSPTGRHRSPRPQTTAYSLAPR